MRALPIALFATVAGVALAPNSALANPTTFAQTFQTSSTPQFSILQSGGSTILSASGQDYFTFLVSGTPFGAPVLSNFSLIGTSVQSGSCGAVGCPNGSSYTQQGFSGSFHYTVASGALAGMNLLSGTFSVNSTPATSGGALVEQINGTGGSFLGTQTPTNSTAVVMSSDFLNFSGVSVEAASWAFSGLSPNFAVNATATNSTMPLTGTAFASAAVGTFSSEPPPTTGSSVPEPATMALMGSALIGLGLLAKKFVRQ